jgi:hypothetical protein
MLSYSPDAVTESVKAMGTLLHRPEWRESNWAPRMRTQLAARLDDPTSHLRYLAMAVLPVIHADLAMRARLIAERVDADDDVTLLAMDVSALNGWVPCELADPVLATASVERSGGPSIPALLADDDDSALDDLRNAWVRVHLNCHLQAGTPHASVVVREWFNEPASHAGLFRSAASSLRNFASFSAEEPLRRPAFELVRSAAATLALDLVRSPADASVALSADALIQELYFASGAGAGSGDKPRPTPEQRAAWYAEGIAALENLTAVTHPHSCYPLLQTLEFFIDDDPARVFRAVAATVKAESMFRFESLGVDVTVRIVERYLADHRQLFVAEPVLLTKLRGMLEVFAGVGWPAALHLSYSLGDVFR